MFVTSTELKNNLSKYLSLAEKEDVFVTKNDVTIAKISSPYDEVDKYLDELTGIISQNDVSEIDIKQDPRAKHILK